MIVGECPTVSDFRENRPFAGALGEELTRMLHDAGILRGECYLTYLYKEALPGGDIMQCFARNKTEAKAQHLTEHYGMFPQPRMLSAIETLWEEIERIKPHVIITLGEVPLWALTHNTGITKWRGSVLPIATDLRRSHRPKVVPTYSPSKIVIKWDWRFLTVHDMRRALKESSYPELRTPDYNFLIRPSFASVMQWLDATIISAELASPYRISCDIETRANHIACIGFANSPLSAICIPLMCVERAEGYWLFEEELAIILKIRELMTHPNVEVVGQNFLFDAQYLAKHWGFVGNLTHDTMIEHHVAFAGLEKGLHFLSSLYCEFHQYWKEEGKLWDPRTMNEEQLWVYNCKDCVITYEASYAIGDAIKSMNLEPARARQMSLFFPTLRMMLRGVRIDEKLKASFGMGLLEAGQQRQQWLIDVAGDTVKKPKSKTAKAWYASPKQLAEYLYETLGLPKQKHRKTGKVTTDDDALVKLRKTEPALQSFFDTLAELRSVGVFYNNFVRAPLDPDKRMRCSYNIAGTETYRYSSSRDAFGFGTNLQNIPAGNEDK